MPSCDPDIVLAKASTVRSCVATIRELRSSEAPDRETWIVRDLTVLNL